MHIFDHHVIACLDSDDADGSGPGVAKLWESCGSSYQTFVNSNVYQVATHESAAWQSSTFDYRNQRQRLKGSGFKLSVIEFEGLEAFSGFSLAFRVIPSYDESCSVCASWTLEQQPS